MKTHVLSALATLALAAAASAQAGGFTTGDVWESNDATAVQGNALLRIDPLTGTVTSMHSSPWQNGFGGLAWDGYRHRLIWRATVNVQTMAQRIWLVDGAGNLADIGLATSSYSWFAPAGDGRIFCIDATGGPQYAAWIDAANRVHRVLDPTGTVPYTLPAGPFYNLRGMAYDSGTNALYAASHIDCDGLGHQQIVIARLALTADGTRVTGAPTCVSYDTTPAFLEFPTALAHLPDGRLLVTTISPDTFPYTLQPALLAFDPASMSFSPFAMVGNVTTGMTYRMDDGVWSSALNKALVLDTFQANLRTWAPGESGDGSVIVPSAPIAVPSAEAEQIAEISPTSCSGAWVPYSVGLAGKGAFVPALMGSGCPVPGAALTLKISDVVGGAGGSLFVGLAPAAVPFKGGVFAVGAVTLTAAIGVGGASGVAGAGTLNLPAALPANPLLTGVSVYMQCGFSDAAAVKGVSLTQGLQMEIG